MNPIIVHFADDAMIRRLAKVFKPAPAWLFALAANIRPEQDKKRGSRITHHAIAKPQ